MLGYENLSGSLVIGQLWTVPLFIISPMRISDELRFIGLFLCYASAGTTLKPPVVCLIPHSNTIEILVFVVLELEFHLGFPCFASPHTLVAHRMKAQMVCNGSWIASPLFLFCIHSS